MIRNALIVVVTLFVLLVASIVLAFIYGGWLGLLGVLVGIVFLLWLIQKFFLRALLWFMTRPLRQQAMQLRGATIDVHEVVRANPPEDGDSLRDALEASRESADPEDGEVSAEEELPPYYSGPRDYYLIDLTITPMANRSGDQAWNPSAITVVPATDSKRHGTAAERKFGRFGFDGRCEIYDFCFWRGASFEEYDDETDHECKGSRRVRLHVGVQLDVDELNLMYFFEVFGSIKLRTTIDV